MNISELFIRRPVATILLMASVLIAGLIAYRQLPVSALPEVDYPTIQVVTSFPGASPDAMSTLVTAPLERQLGKISGLEQMSSSSAAGASVITLQFSLNISMGVAEQEVQAAINAASNLLPQDLPMPPVYNKVNPADTPVITLAVMSGSLPLHEVRDLVESRVLQKISQVSGVGLVSISGGQKPALRIQANPMALASNGLTLNDLRTSINAANVNQPVGSLNGPRRSTTLYTDSQLLNAQAYENLILKYEEGAPLRLKEVARAVHDAEDVRQAAWLGDQQALLLHIQRQPQANVIDVVDEINHLLPELQKALPHAVELISVADRTLSIRDSINSVQYEMMIAIILVILVTFVFLQSLTATLIPAIVVPLSIVGSFAVMYLMGYSLNNLTLMALTIATGFVVDDAIVMIENIARHIEKGVPPFKAALVGAKEIGFTLISLTVSLIAVLFPLLFMEDVIGRLFNEFAVTLAVSILISLVISLTLTPMMCARMLKSEQALNAKPSKGIYFYLERQIDRLIHLYDKSLIIVLRHQFLTLLIAIGTLVLTVFLYLWIPKGFFPVQDTGMIQVMTETDQSISFRRMSEQQLKVSKALLTDEAVESVTSYIGVDGNNASLNLGRLQVELKNHEQRDDIATIVKRLKETVSEIPAIQTYFQASQDLTIDTQISKSQYQMTLSSLDTALLHEWVKPFVEGLEQIDGVTDVTDNYQTQGLEAQVVVDRDLAARYGIQMSQVEEALYNAFGQRLISTIFTQSAQYRVVLEVAPEFSQSLDNFNQVYVSSNDGPVRLTEIATIEPGYTPLEVQRIDQFSSALISFNLKEGYALSEVTPQIDQVADKIEMPLGIEMRYQGATKAFGSSLNNTLWLILAAVFTMYIVLGVLYESFIHPITILSTLPSAAIGALIALMLTGRELDMVGIIGIILLIGIVKKNAIMVIDFALHAERQEGATPFDAVYQAALLRFRPIIMTTLAALFGAVPLMLSSGMGAELRSPLGLVMVGGLICSQLLTLFTTPVIYLYFSRLMPSHARK